MKLFGKFLGFVLELTFICGLIVGGVILLWWLLG
jgi:hypothetical protein